MIGLISILIPNFNKEAFIKRALKSILNQTYAHWECIVVDDGSTDGSWYVLKSFQEMDSRFKLFKRPEYLKKGANSCRNYAFENSEGEYVIWFDSDDILLEDALQNRLKYIDGLDFAGFQGVHWNEVNRVGKIIHQDEALNTIYSFLYFFPKWLTQGLIIKKDFLTNNQITWHEDIPFYQDVFYSLSLLSHKPLHKFNEITVDWIWLDAQESIGKQIRKDKSLDTHLFIASRLLESMQQLEINDKVRKVVILKRMWDFYNADKSKSDLNLTMKYLDFLFQKNLIEVGERKILILVTYLGYWADRKKSKWFSFLYFRFLDWTVYNKVKPYRMNFCSHDFPMNKLLEKNKGTFN